jgi:2',3'-cyclic-nucleotide 2'-phosphodiesterase (5'-nucleotidase family)
LRLHILHTNDVHSAFDGFARIAYKLKMLREKWIARGESVFSFDLGDHADLSNPLSLATNGRINADILGSLPYDGWVLGNNETVTIDQHVWTDLTQRIHAPLYCSNLHFPGSEKNLTGGFIYQLGKLKIGVFGVTVRYEKLFDNLGIVADDPVSVAWQVAQDMRKQGAQLVFLLSHLGLHVDEKLAQDGLPVNLIVGSHTHQYLEHGLHVGKTLIVQAGKHAHALGHVVLDIDEDQQLQSAVAELIIVNDDEVMDSGVMEIIERAQNQVAVWLDAPIATVTPPLTHQQHGESEIVNLLCDQMRLEFQADVALINGGMITGELPTGEILRRDLLSVCATPMRVVTMEAKGDLLWRLISQGLRPELAYKRGYGFGFRGSTIGQIHVSGATVFVENDAQNPHLEHVVEIHVHGELLQLDHTYTIATGEFIALSPDIAVPRSTCFQYQETMLRDLLRRGLGNSELVQEARKHRYQSRMNKA